MIVFDKVSASTLRSLFMEEVWFDKENYRFIVSFDLASDSPREKRSPSKR